MLTILKEEIPLSSLQGTKELFSGRKINLSVLSADDRRVRTVFSWTWDLTPQPTCKTKPYPKECVCVSLLLSSFSSPLVLFLFHRHLHSNFL